MGQCKLLALNQNQASSSQTQHLVMDGNKQLVLVLQPGRRYHCEHRAGWRFLGSSGVVKGLKVVTENDQGQSPTM